MFIIISSLAALSFNFSPNRNPILYAGSSSIYSAEACVSYQMSSNLIRSETITAAIRVSQWVTNTQHATLILSASQRTWLSAFCLYFLALVLPVEKPTAGGYRPVRFFNASLFNDDRIIMLLGIFFIIFFSCVPKQTASRCVNKKYLSTGNKTHLSSGVSTWKVLSITVVHCRHLIMKVLGFGRSVFISWHSVMKGKGRRWVRYEKWFDA